MIIALIPAKAGSSRLPNKNMALINGRPMLDYAIDHALASKRVGAIYVTTDSEEIARHARGRGVRVVMRDASLGGDTPLLTVYRHALNEINEPSVTLVVGVQPDHPDRTVSVDEAIAAFELAGPECDLLYSVEASGKKNGAHYILSRQYLDTDVLRQKVELVDDCTNVHYQEDLERAAARLAACATQ